MGNAEDIKRVLIVDDDKDFVKVHKMCLEKNGFDVTVAYNGQECIDQVNSKLPDIILMDMMMDTFSEGANVVSQLRAMPQTKKIPIILITSINFRTPLEEEDTEGVINVDAYLVKPIESDKLIEQINTTLQNRY